MIAAEKQVRIAAQMYEMRDLLRRIDGAQYHRNLRGWMELVQEVSQAQEISELEAVLMIVQSMKKRGDFTEAVFMRLTVAAVELIEPSEPAAADRVTVPRPVPAARSALPARIRNQDALEAVARRMGVTVADMIGEGRTQPVANARAVAASVLRAVTPQSFPEIAMALGYVSHSSAIAAVMRVSEADELMAARTDVMSELTKGGA